MVLFLLQQNYLHTFVLSINSVNVTSQVVVNNVTHRQSQWRGRGDVKLWFIGVWQNKSDQSESSIFYENNVLLIITPYTTTRHLEYLLKYMIAQDVALIFPTLSYLPIFPSVLLSRYKSYRYLFVFKYTLKMKK